MLPDTPSVKRRRPRPVPLVAGVRAAGAVSVVEHSTRVSAKTRAEDDFSDPLLPNWVPVHGRLKVSSGNLTTYSSLSYVSAYHRTEMLSDNTRVKVTLPGSIPYGRARIWLSGDNLMNRYYGLEINTGLSSKLSIVKGFGPNSVKRFETTNFDPDPGDEIEVWFDWVNAVIRGYQNGVEQLALEVTPYEIQHGPGHRFCGVTLGADWFLEPGVDYADFEAWDVTQPGPVVSDSMDGPGVNPGWVVLDKDVRIHRHWFVPQSMGPNLALYNDAAILWDTEMGTDSVKIVFSVIRVGSGNYTVVLCSNDDMTNWLGVQFESGFPFHAARVVVGTGPTTYSTVGSVTWHLATQMQTYKITYDHDTKTVALFKGAKRTPIVSWTDEGDDITHGAGNRYVGMVWETSLFTAGVEPTAFEAYDVDSDAPL